MIQYIELPTNQTTIKAREREIKMNLQCSIKTDCKYPSLWPSGISVHLRQMRLQVRVLAVSDTYPMFTEPTITRAPLEFSGYIWLDTKIVLKIVVKSNLLTVRKS